MSVVYMQQLKSAWIFARSGKIQDCIDDKKISPYALMRDVFQVSPSLPLRAQPYLIILCGVSQSGGARALPRLMVPAPRSLWCFDLCDFGNSTADPPSSDNFHAGFKSNHTVKFPMQAGSQIQAGGPPGARCGRSRTNRRTVSTKWNVNDLCFVFWNQVYRTHIKILIWQVDNVSIQAGSPIEAGSPIQAGGGGPGHLFQ